MSKTLTINSNISHYRITRKLDAGMGEVYRVRDKRLGRQTAKFPVGRIARARAVKVWIYGLESRL
jgi:hypothetical protein